MPCRSSGDGSTEQNKSERLSALASPASFLTGSSGFPAITVRAGCRRLSQPPVGCCLLSDPWCSIRTVTVDRQPETSWPTGLRDVAPNLSSDFVSRFPARFRRRPITFLRLELASRRLRTRIFRLDFSRLPTCRCPVTRAPWLTGLPDVASNLSSDFVSRFPARFHRRPITFLRLELASRRLRTRVFRLDFSRLPTCRCPVTQAPWLTGLPDVASSFSALVLQLPARLGPSRHPSKARFRLPEGFRLRSVRSIALPFRRLRR
jgi:hypothetical protein